MTGRRFRSVVIIGLMGAGVMLWLGQSAQPSGPGRIPTATGFTLAVTQPVSESHARTIAARVADAGLPVLTRPSSRSFQVVSGPYLTIDEADAAQHLLAKRGLSSRVLVDESIRRLSHDVKRRGSDAANVLLIAGGGSLAVVIELGAEPRHVMTREVTPSELEIVAGPLSSHVTPQEWIAPDGAALLERVVIDEVANGRSGSFRARIITLPSAQPSVRKSGRRIYIDLAMSALPPEPQVLHVLDRGRERVVQDYRASVAPVIEKLDVIEPFVMSAIAAPGSDVFAALERSLKSLQEWTDGVTPPGRWRQSHEYVLAAVQKATESVSADYSGDRLDAAREAFELRDAARRSLETDHQLPATH